MKYVSLFAVFVVCGFSFAVMSDFEGLTYEPGFSYENGEHLSGSFMDGQAEYNSLYFPDPLYPSWYGWAYSKMTDTTSPGYTNQYSAITGGGVDGSENYAIGYPTSWGGTSDINFHGSQDGYVVDGAYFTNTTYAYLAMRDGYFAAKEFGGVSGDDEDWFLLTITGKDALGNVTGTVDFYLADFRFADNSQDYIIDDWTWVDLSSLGVVKSLGFTMTSSDNDPVYGMNTPAYFAMDNFVPEPMTLAILGLGSLMIRRKRG